MTRIPDNIATPPPVQGRTFSLFGVSDSADGYYRTVEDLLDRVLALHPDPHSLLRMLRRLARERGPRLLRGRASDEEREILAVTGTALQQYTEAADVHLAALPLLKRRDGTIAMSRRQYHLGMLEITLVNRMQRERFAACDYRIALLPHCLRDLSRTCKAESDGIDLRCRKCSSNCFVRHVSDLLEQHGIVPYIWMSLGRRALFRILRSKSENPGVLGIACVPELRDGMRLCLRGNLSVVGVPLNANRCARWMGEIHENSVSLAALKALLPHA